MEDKKKKLRVWLMIVFIGAVVIYLGLAIVWKNQSIAPSDSQFKGPTGQPYVKGPTEPPPGSSK